MKTTEEQRKIADSYIGKMTLKEKIQILIETSPENTRLGIPKYYHGNEALHGIIRPGRFTVFPQAIALGAMFDDELVEEIADAISTESRARYNGKCSDGLDEREFEGRYNGLLTFWSPDLNLARDPRWGRTAETYGEDPYLAGKNGAAFVRGLQGNGKFLKAVATPKHFTANNEEHNRFSCDAKMSEKTLREYHLEPFRMAVREGEPEAIMGAYNAINGVPCHASGRLLTDILRKEWGFDGYIVSDCSAVGRLWDHHKKFEKPEQAAAAAMNAGVDLECGGYAEYEHFYTEFLEDEVARGNVSEERIDDAARRVLIARIKAGQFEKEQPFADITLDKIGCREHSELSYRAATKSMVLLKNNGILPLREDEDILVVGNNADVCQFGDYSGKPVNRPVSPLEGIRKIAKDVKHIRWNYVRSREAYSPVPPVCYCTDEGAGIDASFYDNSEFSGIPKKRTDEAVDYTWLERYPDPLITTREYSCVFRGYIVAPKSGDYNFRISAGGYPKCYPPELILEGEKYDGGNIFLRKGQKLPFVVKYSRTSGEPYVKLEWIIPSADNEDELFTSETEAAKNAKIVIAVLGLGVEYEREGNDKTDLRLPREQLLLLKKLYEVNKNIILVIENGSAVSLTEPQEMCSAVLEAWYPGDRGGEAIADILFGRVSPSGRLPLGFPARTEDLPPFDDYEMNSGRTYMYRKIKPLYEFGFGLSYTEFEYSGLCGNSEGVRITVKNIGDFESDEVVQLYIDSAGLENQPKLRLKGFRRIHLKPQETAEVTFSLTGESFSLFDDSGERNIFSGKYRVFVDGHMPDENSSCLEVIYCKTVIT